MELTQDELTRIDAAEAALTAGHDYDALSLAERVGKLEWHLGEMLRVIDGLRAGR